MQCKQINTEDLQYYSQSKKLKNQVASLIKKNEYRQKKQLTNFVKSKATMEHKNKQKEEGKKQDWNLIAHSLNKNCILFPNLIVRTMIKQKLMKWKKLAENSKQRYFKIKQWMQTEATYIKKLLTLRDQVRKPLLESKLITQIDSDTLFSNLDAMIKLSQLVNLELHKIFSNWNPIKSQLSAVLNPLINCLKIYKEYSERYMTSLTFVNEVTKKPSYKAHVKVTNLDDVMSTPVQRFMKYHLFLSKYISLLPSYHKDFESLQKALECLNKATDQINLFITNQDKAKKLIQLQKKFGNIASPSRRFQKELSVMCWEINEQICKVYLFNNLLLVVKVINSHKEQLIQRIVLNEFSFIVKQPDCKSFKNRLYICGAESSIHLNFDYPQLSDNLFSIINQFIGNRYQNQSKRQDIILQNKRKGSTPIPTPFLQSLIDVDENIYNPLYLSAQVMCMQKIFLGQKQIKIFVIKISSAKPFEISQYLFYDYKKLQQLQNMILQICPSVKVPRNYLKEKKNRKQYKIQNRSTAIQIFFNFILRNRRISQHHNFGQILSKIGLHKIMQIYARSNRTCATCLCFECSKVRHYTSFYYYYQHKHRYPKNCIVNSFQTINTIASSLSKNQFKNLKVQQMMVWAKCKLKRIDYTLVQEDKITANITEDQRQKIELQVRVRYASEIIRLVRTQKTIIYSTSRQVIQQIVQILKLNSSSDLALIFVYGEHSTFLDDDQYIYKYAKFLIAQEEENRLPSLRDLFLQKISISKPKENKIKGFLMLRKLYVFHTVLEQASCLNNSQRMKLITGQIFQRIMMRNYQFSHQQAIIFCSLFFYCTIYSYESLDKTNIKIDPSKIKKLLPQSNWQEINKNFITQIENQVSKLIMVEEPIQKVYQKILRQFGNTTIYITQYFQIEDHDQNSQFGFDKDKDKDKVQKYLIGVNYKKILITRQNYKLLFSYPISCFKYRIYGETLYLETDRKTYHFTCKNLFMLDTMIKTYKLINEFTD